MRTLLLAGVVAIGSIGAAQAAIIGDTVSADVRFPTSAKVVAGGNKTVVSDQSVEYPVLNVVMSVDFTVSSIVTTFLDDVSFGSAFYIGLNFSDSSTPFSAYSINLSSTALIAPTNVALLDGNVTIDLSGLTFRSGQTFILDVTTAAASVPEPASLALLAAGLVGAGVVRRRYAG